MRAKNIEILADFRRDLINSKCSEKPVKSRPFRDFKGVKNALRGLLLRVSCEFDSRRECQNFEKSRATSALLLNGYNKIKCVTIAPVITQHLSKTGNLIHCTTKRRKIFPDK